MPRKLLEFDGETFQALKLLGRDGERTLQELADEAFRDLLKKHGRPVTLKEMLKASSRSIPANDAQPATAEANAAQLKTKPSIRRRRTGRSK